MIPNFQIFFVYWCEEIIQAASIRCYNHLEHLADSRNHLLICQITAGNFANNFIEYYKETKISL